MGNMFKIAPLRNKGARIWTEGIQEATPLAVCEAAPSRHLAKNTVRKLIRKFRGSITRTSQGTQSHGDMEKWHALLANDRPGQTLLPSGWGFLVPATNVCSADIFPSLGHRLLARPLPPHRCKWHSQVHKCTLRRNMRLVMPHSKRVSLQGISQTWYSKEGLCSRLASNTKSHLIFS